MIVKIKLRSFNNGLSVVVIIFALYIIVAPFLPKLLFLLRDKSPEAQAPYSGQLAEDVGSSTTAPPPEDNRLVIPSISLNQPIFESPNIGVISAGGTWRRPNTSDPTKDSNTVIVGHRYYGQNTSTFYNLDQIKIGDKIATYWEGTEYVYSVTEITVVAPSRIDIEAPTDEKQLTLYTCHPLWTSKNRLVIIAKPVVSNDENQGV